MVYTLPSRLDVVSCTFQQASTARDCDGNAAIHLSKRKLVATATLDNGGHCPFERWHEREVNAPGRCGLLRGMH